MVMPLGPKQYQPVSGQIVGRAYANPPSAKRLSISATASLWTPLIKWPYTSIVVEMLEWPTKPAMAFACTPPAIISETAVWRRPCSVRYGRPDARRIFAKSLLRRSPLIGPPFSPVKTWPSPFHASPRRSCRSSCLTLTRRRTSAAPALSAMVRLLRSLSGASSAGRVRLYGLDTPERGERCFQEATDRFSQLTGVTLRVESGPRERGPFGRLLCYVYARSGDSIDKRLIREGLAEAWTRDGQHRDHLVRIASKAQESGTSMASIEGAQTFTLARSVRVQ